MRASEGHIGSALSYIPSNREARLARLFCSCCLLDISWKAGHSSSYVKSECFGYISGRDRFREWRPCGREWERLLHEGFASTSKQANKTVYSFQVCPDCVSLSFDVTHNSISAILAPLLYSQSDTDVCLWFMVVAQVCWGCHALLEYAEPNHAYCLVNP